MSDDPAEDPTGRRSRRARTKVVNYSKEQEFSDEDLFEDVAQKETPPAPTTVQKKKKTKGTRKSKGRKSSSKKQQQQQDNADFADPFEDDDEYEYVPAKPVYSEKGYDPSLPPIRERFPFLPEYELDGSPRIDLIVGRRPVEESDNKKEGQKANTSDDDDNDGSDTGDDVETESGGPKRRGRKKGKRNNGVKKSSSNKNSIVEYEYLVKYKNLSYMHLEWKSGADLESMNKSAKTMYRRYLKKVSQGQDEELENPEFDPSFVVVQKVLAEEEQELELEAEGEELAKWERQREKELAEEDLSEEEREKEEERLNEEEKVKEEEKLNEEERLRLEKEAKKAKETAVAESSDKKDGETEGQKDSCCGEKKESTTEEKKGEFSSWCCFVAKTRITIILILHPW